MLSMRVERADEAVIGQMTTQPTRTAGSKESIRYMLDISVHVLLMMQPGSHLCYKEGEKPCLLQDM